MKRTGLSVFVLLALLAAAWPRAAEASTLDAGVMKAALLAGTPQAQAFIDKVVARVEQRDFALGSGSEHVPLGKKEAREEVFLFQASPDFAGGGPGNQAVGF